MGWADEAQHAELEEARKQIVLQFEQASKACWRVFWVNDCLAKARSVRYQSLAPIQELEQKLRREERAIKEAERLQRLSEKSPPKDSH
ncbi:MAG: hypothetical protein ACOYL0_13250 [Limnohabitans sp.]|jgi:hypothetical protein|nr:hypothetical protein [Burkholderiales bacterium]